MQTPASECPVVLVHGWKSHPRVWKDLCSRFEEASITYWNFSHAGLDTPPAQIAGCLRDFIRDQRERSGYFGPVDIVCHSAGTCIVRYMLEIQDGTSRQERVRQLIALGPPNNGSSMAEIFNHPEYGPEIVEVLAGVFVPRDYDPALDPIVQEIRPNSRTIAELRAAGIRSDIRYRLILSENRTRTPDLFPHLNGKTWAFLPDGTWGLTYAGDGIIPHTDSYLPGAGVDILPSAPELLSASPARYSHIALPNNPEVIDRILIYIRTPSTVPGAICGDEWAKDTGIPPWHPDQLIPNE